MNSNIKEFKDTRSIIRKGKYEKGNKEVILKLNRSQNSEAIYLSENEIKLLYVKEEFKNRKYYDNCKITVSNKDSFEAARDIQRDISDKEEKVLVLNFANATHSGGGVRRGARAQEEDLCRKSTLLFSLESDDASKYYACHKKYKEIIASHGMIVSPNVEIIKDTNYELLDETKIVSVLTCAAPINTNHISQIILEDDYEVLLYDRIKYMLFIAAYLGYKHLVLGAWGCGAFSNDAELIARLFKKALEEPCIGNISVKNYFKTIEFAVLCKSKNTYNYDCFQKVFSYN